MSLKVISYLELLKPLCLVERNHLCNFDRRDHEEQFWEIIFNLDQWFRRRYRLKIFKMNAANFLSGAEQNHLCNFGKGHYDL